MDDEIAALRARIERLEQLAGLQVETPKPFPPPEPVPAPVQKATPPPMPAWAETATPLSAPAAAITPPPMPKSAVSSEAWLARVGIGLLVIGVIFFLKLTLNRGWITPQLQLIGAAIGCGALLWWGDRTGRARPGWGHLVFGGGIAGLIAVATAGQFLYHLWDGWISCILTLVVALACLGQSLRRESAALCVLALLGIFAGPLFMGLDEPRIFTADAILALALALATYLGRGWRSVVTVGGIGSWIMLSVGVLELIMPSHSGDRATVQIGIIICWLGLWIVPMLRAWLHRDKPPMGVLWTTAFLPALTGAGLNWVLSDWGQYRQLGVALAFLAVLSAAAGVFWRQAGLKRVAAPQFVGVAVLGAMAIVLFFDGWPCWVTLAVFAAVLHQAAHIEKERPLQIVAHFVSLACLFMLAFLEMGLSDSVLWEGATLLSSTALLLSLGATAWIIRSRPAAGFYRILFYIGLLGLMLAAGMSKHWSPEVTAVGWVAVAAAAYFGLPLGRAIELRGLAHVVTFILYVWAAALLLSTTPQWIWLNSQVMAALAVLALSAVIGWPERKETLGAAHYWLAYALWLEMVYVQFRDFGHGGLVSVTWAVTAVALIIGSVARDSKGLRIAGFATLLLMILRLFVVDLASLDLAAKTLVFIGIGIFLLAAGYFLPRFLAKRD